MTDASGVTNFANVLVKVDAPGLPEALELRGLKRFMPSEIDKTKRSQSGTLRHTGGSEIEGLTLLDNDPDDRDFRVSGRAVRCLKAGESTAVMIEFRGGEEGRRKATLFISTNDPSISIVAPLSGRGKNSGVRFPAPGIPEVTRLEYAVPGGMVGDNPGTLNFASLAPRSFLSS